jgi:membrane-anchored protein YejM (alkaline phosphatase superfamily)
MGSENEKSGGLDDMAKDLLLFDEVYCQNSIMSMTGDRKLNGYSKTLSDHQLMKGLVKYLSGSDRKKKLFMSVYNLGTHAWFDTHKDSLKYKDGKISIYNVVYDFDHAFGQFWNYFKKSPYYNNTIVIITADHCYPPESDFVKLAGDDYSPYFVDRVPLIIYDPFHKLPHTYTGATRTSIDFAPTLLHLMEIPEARNHFLGASLFDSKPHSPDQFSAVGDRPYLITKQGIFTRPEDYELVSRYVDAKNYIDYLQTLELSNRVWGDE